MQWFRTIPHVIRMLVVLFLVAQFAGVVSSPRMRSHSAPGAAVAHANHQHAEDDRADGHRHDGCAYRTPAHANTTPIIAAHCMHFLPASCRPQLRWKLAALPAKRFVRA
jgi:hypothetical protein